MAEAEEQQGQEVPSPAHETDEQSHEQKLKGTVKWFNATKVGRGGMQ
jgi:hypothetical protein